MPKLFGIHSGSYLMHENFSFCCQKVFFYAAKQLARGTRAESNLLPILVICSTHHIWRIVPQYGYHGYYDLQIISIANTNKVINL